MAEKSDEGLNKRAIIVVAIPVLIVAVFLVLFFVVFNGNDDSNTVDPLNSVESNIEITEAEQLEAEGLAESFVKEAGNFGVKKDQVNAENIDEMATLLGTDPNSASNYFTPRSLVYEGLDQYIYNNSPLYYPESVYSQWDNSFETSTNASFTVEEVEANAATAGTYITIDDRNMKSFSVNVRFNSKETMFIEQGSEIGAERSYSVMEKEFSNNTATFVFVYEEHEGEDEAEHAEHSSGSDWKLYSIKDLKNEFLLASWDDPSMEDFSDTQFSFVENGKIVPTNQNIQPALPEQE